MAIDPIRDIARAFEQGTPIDEALNEAVREAVRLHKRMGQPLAVWRDGKTVWISPEEVDLASKHEGSDEAS